MIILNCYLLKTEIVETTGESVGELPQYLLQVDRYNEDKSKEETRFIYLSDNIDENLMHTVIDSLCDNKVIEHNSEYIIDINNSNIIIEWSNGRYNIVE